MTSLIENTPPEEPVGPDPMVMDSDPVQTITEDPTPAADPDMFPRAYVEELRQENAKHRTRAKAYDDAFDGMDDDTREAWLEYTSLVVKAQRGDQDAIDQINEMFGEDDDEPGAAPEPVALPEQPDYAALARQAAEDVYRERETARVQEEQIMAVRQAGEDLGYKFGTEDYILFVRGANEAAQAGSDDPIKAGDAAVKAYRQQIVDAYLKAKGQQAEETVATPDGGGAAPNLATAPFNPADPNTKKWQDVRESAMARFRQ